MPDAPPFDHFAADGAQRLAWSPDGHTIALGGEQLRLIDSADGTTRWEAARHGTSWVNFSPNGELIAACDIDGGSVSITMFDVNSGDRLWTRSHAVVEMDPGPDYDPNNPVGSVIRIGFTGLFTGLGLGLLTPVLEGVARTRFSPDGRLVAFAGLLLDTGTGVDGVSLPAEPRTAELRASELPAPMPPAFSPDSRMAAVRTGTEITVFDLDTPQALWSAACPSTPVWACFVKDELIVVCDPAVEILRFDAATGAPAGTRPLDPPAPGFSIPFIQDPPGIFGVTPGGRSIVAIGGGIGQDMVTVYNTDTGTARFPAVKIIRPMVGSGATRGMLSPLGERIALNSPGLTVVRTRSGVIDWEEPDSLVADVGFHPNGSKLAAIVDDQLRVYDTGLMAPPISVNGPVETLSVTGGVLPLLAVGSQHEGGHGVAYLFQATEGTIVLEKPDQGLVKAVLSRNGHKLATGRTSGVVAIYDTMSESDWFAIRPGGSVNDLAFDDTGALLGTASSDKTARLIDVATESERWSTTHPASVRHLVLDPQGRWMATACNDQTTRILETDRGTVTAQFPNEGQVITGQVQALTVALDRPLVAAAYDGGVVLVIDAAAGVLIGQADHSRPVAAAALNAPGNLLASGGRDNTIRISVVTTSEVVTDLSVPTGSEVIELAFNPADGLLAAATYDGAVHVLEPSSGDELIRLPHPQSVTRITFSRDGSLLAVGCKDGFAYVYPARWS